MKYFIILMALVSNIAFAHNNNAQEKETNLDPCQNKHKKEPCNYMNETQKAVGTCQLFSDTLICVSNPPVENGTNAAKAVLLKEYRMSIDVNHSGAVYF
ncbi:hypothetical protein [Alteromonas sp. 14N.309.X.WAT.G.H12]|uniref:hypothetical protein n=1 Tax=Alteromonas sp. 14N.309.X.WAT.G.H12 TaxID=3120824 RepID=UPI002FCF88B4